MAVVAYNYPIYHNGMGMNSDYHGMLYEERMYTGRDSNEELSSLLRASITNHDFDFCSMDHGHELGLDPEIQELILENDQETQQHTLSLYCAELSQNKLESDSDNDSVIFDLPNLDFLDSDTDESSGTVSPPLKMTLRNDSVDSGYGEGNLPNFDSLDCGRETPHVNRQYYDDDEDLDSKPYCKSNRGAKKNLLWKFILKTLDQKQNLVSWVNEREGIFKFVNTADFSKRWGEKKRKSDMNFEKLSRGIRHYYRSGLMERVASERLVYKFNWPSVPRRFRKY